MPQPTQLLPTEAQSTGVKGDGPSGHACGTGRQLHCDVDSQTEPTTRPEFKVLAAEIAEAVEEQKEAHAASNEENDSDDDFGVADSFVGKVFLEQSSVQGEFMLRFWTNLTQRTQQSSSNRA